MLRSSLSQLPPIGCNGRGAQASSKAVPVSLTEPSIEEQFRLVHETGVFDSFDRLPLVHQLQTYRQCMERWNLPVLTASWFYVLGQDEELLLEKLRLAAAVGARQHNIMVHWHDAKGRPVTDQEVVDFYLNAYDQGMPMGVEPTVPPTIPPKPPTSNVPPTIAPTMAPNMNAVPPTMAPNMPTPLGAPGGPLSTPGAVMCPRCGSPTPMEGSPR